MTQDEAPDSDEQDHAGVRIPPPVIFIVFLAAGIVMDSPWMSGNLAALSAMGIGGVLFVISGVLALKSVPRHRKEGSNVEPWKPTTKIISDGIYGRSRNPIYVSMSLLYISLAIMAGSLIALYLVVPCLVVIRYYVIGREETYLEAKFGDDYLQYKTQVRRWF